MDKSDIIFMILVTVGTSLTSASLESIDSKIGIHKFINDSDNSKSNTLCSDSIFLIWKFAWLYFEDRHAVMILGVNDSSLEFSHRVTECGMENYRLPLKTMTRGTNETKIKSVRKVFKPRLTDAYFFIATGADPLLFRMNVLSKLDPNCKIAMVLTNGTAEDAERILVEGWRRYQMLNLIVYRVIPGNLDNPEVDIYVYNPFIMTADQAIQKRGRIFKSRMQNDDSLMERLLRMIDERLWNVHGYPLRICIFENPGTVAPASYRNGTITKYTLQDGEIIDTIAYATNFRASYFNPRDGVPYGHQLPNGSITGSLKEVDIGEADILANLRPVKDYGQQRSGFLFPADQMDLAFMTPKMPSVAMISFLEIFSIEASIALAVIYLVVVLLWKRFQTLHHKWRLSSTNNFQKQLTFTEICVMTFGNYLLISQNGRESRFEKCLFTGWVFFSMINCFTYQGTMVEHLATSTVSQDINTMEDLAKSGLKILTVTGFKELLKDIAAAEDAPEYFKVLYSRQELVDKPAESLRRVAEVRDAAMLYSLMGCKMNESNAFSKDGARRLIHVLEEAPPVRYSAHMVPVDSPYRQRFDLVVMKIRESGLMPKWRKDVYHDINKRLERKIAKTDEAAAGESVYTMRELSFIFTSWLMCCGLSALVFVMELLVHAAGRRKRKK